MGTLTGSTTASRARAKELEFEGLDEEAAHSRLLNDGLKQYELWSASTRNYGADEHRNFHKCEKEHDTMVDASATTLYYPKTATCWDYVFAWVQLWCCAKHGLIERVWKKLGDFAKQDGLLLKKKPWRERFEVVKDHC